MASASHTHTTVSDRLSVDRLLAAALGSAAIVAALIYAVAFDQGILGSLITEQMLESGGVLHELFHDARHLLGVPCH